MKKVIVACGSGVATSQTVASKVNRLLKEKNVDAKVDAVDLKSVDRYLVDAAAYITITKVTKEYPIPVKDSNEKSNRCLWEWGCNLSNSGFSYQSHAGKREHHQCQGGGSEPAFFTKRASWSSCLYRYYK